MAKVLGQLGSKLSVFQSADFSCDWESALKYCQFEVSGNGSPQTPADADHFLYDVLLKTLQRGSLPYCSYSTEQRIVGLYGNTFGLREKARSEGGSISYDYDAVLCDVYTQYSDFLDLWNGDVGAVAFDPANPQNERYLFEQVLGRFGNSLAHCIYPQAEISSIIDPVAAAGFGSQHADFVLVFPNGNGFVLEPGDHHLQPNAPQQQLRDNQRDAAFRNLGFTTLRPTNAELRDEYLYAGIEKELESVDGFRYLQKPGYVRNEYTLAQNYLFLLPALIARIEWLLLDFLLLKGLRHRPKLAVGFIERDLECAEIALLNLFGRFGRLERLAKIYGIEYRQPEINLYVIRNPEYRFGNLSVIDDSLASQSIQVSIVDGFDELELDILLDVGIKCNYLTHPISDGADYVGSVRQVYPHNQEVSFSYYSRPRKADLSFDTAGLYNSFVQDFFRKHELRPGQEPIISNVLTQESTIGLLPTSAGKSLCYQLAALLTPGTTFVVDPINALMNDQVQSLHEQYGIDRSLAWHSGANIAPNAVASTLGKMLIVFISPERLLRENFRAAMRSLNARGVYVNYGVIDEAHCVSMWGHDFRPSYLTLKRNFMEYCTFQGHEPVIVALTGTASQLVLIDLRRELDIENLDSIIRPDSFNRPELEYHLLTHQNNDKEVALKNVMQQIGHRLGVNDLAQDAHGIIFTHYPNEVWNLFGQFVGNADQQVDTVLQGHQPRNVLYGMCSGKKPGGFPAGRNWAEYKRQTLRLFKRGEIRMLFGNTAVSVGIDKDKLNYVINYRLPQSMESLYQQWGRAGRSGQHSFCYQIFSDDNPDDTQNWVGNRSNRVGSRRDDIGIVTWFHTNGFPGDAIETAGAQAVLRYILGNLEDGSSTSIRKVFAGVQSGQAERTEQYISYWLMLGVVEDYEVSGMGENTTYQIRLNDEVAKLVADQNVDDGQLEEHIVRHLHAYRIRYRPTSLEDVKADVRNHGARRLSEKCVGSLIDFIYKNIVYQRRAAIGTVIEFCKQTNADPELLRTRLNAYFDTSRFTKSLMDMAEHAPNIDAVADLLRGIEQFDDAEHLYWETRRLLDERYRMDWAAVSLYAVAFRESAIGSDTFMRLLDEMIKGLREDEQLSVQDVRSFLTGFFSYLMELKRVVPIEVATRLLASCFHRLYKTYKMEYIGIIKQVSVDVATREYIELHITNAQIKEIADAADHSGIVG